MQQQKQIPVRMELVDAIRYSKKDEITPLVTFEEYLGLLEEGEYLSPNFDLVLFSAVHVSKQERIRMVTKIVFCFWFNILYYRRIINNVNELTLIK